jgi:hypothetical protein
MRRCISRANYSSQQRAGENAADAERQDQVEQFLNHMNT